MEFSAPDLELRPVYAERVVTPDGGSNPTGIRTTSPGTTGVATTCAGCSRAPNGTSRP